MSGMEIDWKTEIPQPVFDEHPEWVDFYHEAWETIAGKLVDRPGFPQTPCMEAPSADGNTFRLSDACFLAMITKYARGSLPGVESLANFYHALYGPDPVPGLNISDQSSAPLFGWAEYENALLSGDTRHVRALLRSGYLQRHYEKLETLEAPPKGETISFNAARRVRGYHWTENEAGMARSLRGLGLPPEQMFWVDLLSQQCLAALCVSRLAALVCDTVLSAKWRGKYSGKKTLLRRWYWNNETALFYDIDSTTMHQVAYPTCAGFWPLVSGCPDLHEAGRMAETLRNPDYFGGDIPFPTLARCDARFDPDEGAGWRGAVRIPSAYVALRGLSHAGRHHIPNALGTALLRHVWQTYHAGKPKTFWDAYSPVKPEPAYPAPGRTDGIAPQPDTSGASCLVPICVFLENVIGVHYIDAFRRLVEWDPPAVKGRIGIRNLSFGTNVVDLVTDGIRLFIRAKEPFTLQIFNQRLEVPTGPNIYDLPKREEYALPSPY